MPSRDRMMSDRPPALSHFLACPASVFGHAVCRLGLATRGLSGTTSDDVLYAIERGVNFLNWPGLAEGPDGADAISDAVAGLGRRRGDVVVCAQFWGRTGAEAAE